MGEVTECGLCGSTDLAVILDMGEQPLAERYGTDERHPLALAECGDCSLVQLTFIPGQRDVFPLDHPYATGNSAALREHFAALAARIGSGPPGVIVDIGANDGTLLAAYGPDVRRIAVEPTNQAAKCRAQGIITYQEFFTRGLAWIIRATQGPARVITACNVLAHVPDPHDFVAGVVDLLAGDGVFVTENHDVASVTEGLQVDTVYHEHLRFYSVASLSRLLAMHGLRVDEVERIPTHGGSFRVWARKPQPGLQQRADRVMAALHSLVAGLHDQGHRIYGVGATTRATPLIHYAGIGKYLSCVCEVAGSEKIGLTMPGTDLVIVDEAALATDQPEYALILSWHIADHIIPALRKVGYQGQFIIPLPEPGVTDG